MMTCVRKHKQMSSFILQGLTIWAVCCIPVNIITYIFWQKAPVYNHSKNSSFNNGSTSHSQIQGESLLQWSCHEDMDDFISVVNTFEFILSGVLISIVGFLGLIGNMFALIILLKFEHQNSFNKLLVGLTVIDILLILSFVLEFSILNVWVGRQPLWYTILYPLLIHPLKSILLSACIFMMVAVSAERCQAICHPLRERPSPVYYLLFVVVLSLSLNARKYGEFQPMANGDYETTSIMEYPPYILFSTIWQELFITGVVPFSALIFYNWKIYAKIKESSLYNHCRYVGGQRQENIILEINVQPTDSIGDSSEILDLQRINRESEDTLDFDTEERSQEEVSSYRQCLPKGNVRIKASSQGPRRYRTTGQRKLRKRHEKSVIILILIVYVFLICHSFRLGVQFYQTLYYSYNIKDNFLYCIQHDKLHMPGAFMILTSFNNLFLILNSSVNFIIYCAIRKSFRLSFVALCKTPIKSLERLLF